MQIRKWEGKKNRLSVTNISLYVVHFPPAANTVPVSGLYEIIWSLLAAAVFGVSPSSADTLGSRASGLTPVHELSTCFRSSLISGLRYLRASFTSHSMSASGGWGWSLASVLSARRSEVQLRKRTEQTH